MSVLTKSKVQEFISGLSFSSNVEVQKQAFAKLEGLDFPTSRDEYWKYTKVGKIANSKFQISTEGKLSAKDIEQYLVSDHFIVVENGNIRMELSSFDLAALAVK